MTSAKRAEQYGHTSRSNEEGLVFDEVAATNEDDDEDDGILLWSLVEG